MKRGGGAMRHSLFWDSKLQMHKNWSDFVSPMCTSEEEYSSSLQEKLPLIIGSAAAGVVFLIAVVVLIIVCNRWVCCLPWSGIDYTKLNRCLICSFSYKPRNSVSMLPPFSVFFFFSCWGLIRRGSDRTESECTDKLQHYTSGHSE